MRDVCRPIPDTLFSLVTIFNYLIGELVLKVMVGILCRVNTNRNRNLNPNYNPNHNLTLTQILTLILLYPNTLLNLT